MSARESILQRIRETLETRSAVPHPGDFRSWGLVERPSDDATSVDGASGTGTAADRFVSAFTAAGGEVARVSGLPEARRWLEETAAGFSSLVVGESVPEHLLPGGARAPAHTADLGISRASSAAADTGTIILESSDGRRAQLLAPVHVVILREETVNWTLADALGAVRHALPSAVGLHSGPSKSADIGQVMVRGVHGPGRIVALLVAAG